MLFPRLSATDIGITSPGFNPLGVSLTPSARKWLRISALMVPLALHGLVKLRMKASTAFSKVP